MGGLIDFGSTGFGLGVVEPELGVNVIVSSATRSLAQDTHAVACLVCYASSRNIPSSSSSRDFSFDFACSMIRN